MKKMIIAVTVFVVFVGCATVPEQPPISEREQILKYLDYGKIGVSLGLNFALSQGADPDTINQIQLTANQSFNLIEDVIRIEIAETSKVELQKAFNQIKLVIKDTLILCRTVGINESVIDLIEVNAETMYPVIQTLIDSLPDEEIA